MSLSRLIYSICRVHYHLCVENYGVPHSKHPPPLIYVLEYIIVEKEPFIIVYVCAVEQALCFNCSDNRTW